MVIVCPILANADEAGLLDLDQNDIGILFSSGFIAGGVADAGLAITDHMDQISATGAHLNREIILAETKRAQLQKLADSISPKLAETIKSLEKDLYSNSLNLNEKAKIRERLFELKAEHYLNATENPNYKKIELELAEQIKGVGKNSGLRKNVYQEAAIKSSESTLRKRLFRGGFVTILGAAGTYYFANESSKSPNGGAIKSGEFNLKRPSESSANTISEPDSVKPQVEPAH
jgi:hypothetical protein